MWSLLDADQVIPWADQRLKFHHKYRFWIQPYTKGYHTPLEYGNGAGFYLGSPYEYDVPKCDATVPGCTLVDGSWVHTIHGSKMGNPGMASLNFHCHAPTCISMSIWTCPKVRELRHHQSSNFAHFSAPTHPHTCCVPCPTSCPC